MLNHIGKPYQIGVQQRRESHQVWANIHENAMPTEIRESNIPDLKCE